MANWKVVIENGWLSEVSNFYGPHFPVETRGILEHFLAQNAAVLTWGPYDVAKTSSIMDFVSMLETELKRQVEALPRQSPRDFQFYLIMTAQAKQIEEQSPFDTFLSMRRSMKLEMGKVEELLNARASNAASGQ